MKFNFILLGLALLVCSQNVFAKKKKKNTRKTTIVKAQVVTPPATSQPNNSNILTLCNNDYNFPYWHLALVKGFTFPENMQAPSQYRLTTINALSLNEYLKAVPYEQEGTKKIQFPIYRNGIVSCKEYLIERVPTMDSALQAKYPELMSFRAYEPNNLLNTARVDCNSETTSVMITDEGETFFITPVVFNKNTFYVCYAKNDPNLRKEKFER